jgi:transposase
VVLSKYVDYLPLYRLEQMSSRWGASISRQSMCDWIEVASDWLEPIYRRMLTNLRRGGYLQADETPIRCHDPDEKRGATTQGWLWVISRPGGDVVFDWRLSRRHGELNTLLADYKGVLQSDGYEAYPHYAENHEGVVWVGCWAHARRKFNEAQLEAPKATRIVLKLIAKMYRLERQWDEAGLKDLPTRSKLRTEHFARTLKWLMQIGVDQRKKARPQSLLGKACDYLLAHWDPLTAHLRHGGTRLDNNLVENAIRPSAIGKKYGKVAVMESDGRSRTRMAWPTFHITGLRGRRGCGNTGSVEAVEAEAGTPVLRSLRLSSGGRPPGSCRSYWGWHARARER